MSGGVYLGIYSEKIKIIIKPILKNTLIIKNFMYVDKVLNLKKVNLKLVIHVIFFKKENNCLSYVLPTEQKHCT